MTTVVAASTNSISLDTVRSRLLGLQAAQLVVVLSVLAALVFNPTVCLRDVADPRFG